MSAKSYFEQSAAIIQSFIATNEQALQDIAISCIQCIEKWNKLLICWNGWSAADAQHFAAEIVWTFYNKSRKALPAIALTTDTSAITAIWNDLWFDKIFSRQVEWLAQNGDILIAISTSWNSKNCITAIQQANAMWTVKTIWFLWNTWGEMLNICDYSLVVDSQDTPLIQQVHLCCYHWICAEIDKHFS